MAKLKNKNPKKWRNQSLVGLKPEIDCKNNGKWKLQACFSWKYDFAFTNLLKIAPEWLSTVQGPFLTPSASTNDGYKLNYYFHDISSVLEKVEFNGIQHESKNKINEK